MEKNGFVKTCSFIGSLFAGPYLLHSSCCSPPCWSFTNTTSSCPWRGHFILPTSGSPQTKGVISGLKGTGKMTMPDLTDSSESEFNEFETRLKSAKNRF